MSDKNAPRYAMAALAAVAACAALLAYEKRSLTPSDHGASVPNGSINLDPAKRDQSAAREDGASQTNAPTAEQLAKSEKARRKRETETALTAEAERAGDLWYSAVKDFTKKNPYAAQLLETDHENSRTYSHLRESPEARQIVDWLSRTGHSQDDIQALEAKVNALDALKQNVALRILKQHLDDPESRDLVMGFLQALVQKAEQNPPPPLDPSVSPVTWPASIWRWRDIDVGSFPIAVLQATVATGDSSAITQQLTASAPPSAAVDLPPNAEQLIKQMTDSIVMESAANLEFHNIQPPSVTELEQQKFKALGDLNAFIDANLPHATPSQ